VEIEYLSRVHGFRQMLNYGSRGITTV